MNSHPRRHARRWLLVLAVLILAGWFLPSYISANRYRRRLESGLQSVLHRPVRFAAVSFRLLPHPGFSIQNAVVQDDQAFGSEPFAHIDRIDCDLRWHGLAHSHFEFARLYLDHPVLNIVRNARGEWNVERLFVESGTAAGSRRRNTERSFEIDADQAQLNFTIARDKKPFSITDLRARLNFDPGQGLLRYEFVGTPIRTDLSFPTPGELEFRGTWIPGKRLEGPIDGTLRTKQALIYDWVPLVTGRNPGIYGVLDAQVHMAGSLRLIKMDGQGRVTQLHRWESIPPSGNLPCSLQFRGVLDRDQGMLSIETAQASFGQSQIRLSGTIDRVPESPTPDLALSAEGSRLEDLLDIGRRLTGKSRNFELSGSADAFLSIRAGARGREYSGYVLARTAKLVAGNATLPLSDLDIRINEQGVRLAPARLSLGPHADVIFEGTISRNSPPESDATSPANRRMAKRITSPAKAEIPADAPTYQLALSARAASLPQLVRAGRRMGIHLLQDIDAQGVVNAGLVLKGRAWPVGQPSISGNAELREARLALPGLSEPVRLARCRIQVNGDEVRVEPMLATIGTTSVRGQLEYHGGSRRLWSFDLTGSAIDLDEAAQWFDLWKRRSRMAVMELIPGLGSSSNRRLGASDLFSAMRARGRIFFPTLTYRNLTMTDFQADMAVADRTVRIGNASFQTVGGRAQGQLAVNFAAKPATIEADLAVASAKLQAFASHFPEPLRETTGLFSGSAHVETRGLTRQEAGANLKGEAKIHLQHVSFGSFDPLELMLREGKGIVLEPDSRDSACRSALAELQIRDRHVLVRADDLELNGAKLGLSADMAFDGSVDLAVRADLRHFDRTPSSLAGVDQLRLRLIDFHAAGPIDNLAVIREQEPVP